MSLFSGVSSHIPTPFDHRKPRPRAPRGHWLQRSATICDDLQRLGRRAQPGRRRVGRKAARGAAHLCDPVAVERDPVDYGAGNRGLELRVVTGCNDLQRLSRRPRIYKVCARQHRGSE